jgi:competence protein ComEA
VWDFNRTERKALLLAAGLIGLSALGRLASGPGRGDVSWVAESPGSRRDDAAGAMPKEGVEAALRREARAFTPLAAGERLDPNRAPEEELRRLPGIGPARARAILEERARGAFDDPEALLRVPGIGPATYARIAPFLTVEGRAGGPDDRPNTPLASGCGADNRVDVNTATEAELRALPGIGSVLAHRIVRSRMATEAFAGPEALLGVSGIGPRLLERLRNRVCFSSD